MAKRAREWRIGVSPRWIFAVMMEHASGYRPAQREARWIIATKHFTQDWEIIVQPESDTKVLGVVTAYAVTREKS